MREMEAREVLTFDLNGVDAKGLGQRFAERCNVIVTTETIDGIKSTEGGIEKCQEIFEKIKSFRRFNGASDKEMKDADVNLGKLDINNGKVKDLKTKEEKEPLEPKEKKEKDKAEKESKSEREKIRELLRILLSRIPIYMYLTDACEESLDDVLALPMVSLPSPPSRWFLP